jgi:hypothetical protein
MAWCIKTEAGGGKQRRKVNDKNKRPKYLFLVINITILADHTHSPASNSQNTFVK